MTERKLTDLPADMRNRDDLENEIRYQTSPGVHTIGPCTGSCGNGARGARWCANCCRAYLELLRPHLTSHTAEG